MDKQKLLIYEAPSWIEYISFSWGQELAARYLARKVTRKLRRYEERLDREQWIKGQLERIEGEHDQAAR